MTSNNLSTMAEDWFDQYLVERGYTWQVEPDVGLLGRIKNPDRLVSAHGFEVVCEVKSFNTPGLFADAEFRRSEDGNRVAGPKSRSMKDALKPLRSQIKQAAAQLKAAQSLGHPLMVVMANPMNCPVPSDDMSLMAAMYGDHELHGTLDPDTGEIAEWTMTLGRNGKLTMDHPYVSAVAWLHHQDRAVAWYGVWMDENRAQYGDDVAGWLEAMRAVEHEAPTGSDVWLTIVETVSESAVPLPRDVFDGPRDVRYVPTPDRTGLTLYQH
ncbi:hypothetical protein ACIBK1_33625 [Microbispora rosea]|uniref:hypothetical protein n=1 Tax=Microbispora rosea TaxID=58117 RepID=UPI003795C742